MSDLRVVADLMAIAARTAPKSAGHDFVVVRVVEGDEVRALGNQMIEYGPRTGKKDFDRDGKNVFVVEARVDLPYDWMRPGMEGSARIVVGKRPVWWIALHRGIDSVRYNWLP